MTEHTLPTDLPPRILEAVGDASVAAVHHHRRGLVAYDLTVRDGWPIRVLKVAPANDPYVAVSEVDRIDWIERRLPCPKILATSPMPGGGHAVVLSLPPGSPAMMPEHRLRPMRTVEHLAKALRFVHEIPVESCPFDARIDLRLRSIKRRLLVGQYDSSSFTSPYNRYAPYRLHELLTEMRPPDDDPVFTHGAFGLDVALLDLSGVCGIVDWGRAGVSDRYVDLSTAVRSIADTLGPELIPHFFQCYGLEHPDPRKLDFYALLTEFE